MSALSNLSKATITGFKNGLVQHQEIITGQQTEIDKLTEQIDALIEQRDGVIAHQASNITVRQEIAELLAEAHRLQPRYLVEEDQDDDGPGSHWDVYDALGEGGTVATEPDEQEAHTTALLLEAKREDDRTELETSEYWLALRWLRP